MKSKDIIREQFLEVVDNQVKANDPAETAATLKRLKEAGYNDQDARLLIAQCVAIEIFHVMKSQTPFDEKRYVKNLAKLPGEPFED